MILVRHGESHFNVAFRETRQDPGLVDPGLTDAGLEQAAAAAEQLVRRGGIRRILASPYARTLHTAAIIAQRLGLPVRIEPLVREHAWFTCDVGSPRSHLEGRWPSFDFGDLPERWWPERETEDELLARCRRFRAGMAGAADWSGVLVVSHWGFIRGLTGEALQNGQALGFDPVAGRALADQDLANRVRASGPGSVVSPGGAC